MADLLRWGRENLLGVNGGKGRGAVQGSEWDASLAGSAARVDAEVLLSYVTGDARASLIAQCERAIPAGQVRQFQALIKRRAGGEPVAYLTGRQGFWSLDLEITPAVLIPRPETELLVERALVVIADVVSPLPTVSLLELGTGSGAIALALASELPNHSLTATDISPTALEVAKRNAKRLGLSAVAFRQSDWFDRVAPQRFAMIIANPPYVAADDPHLTAGDLRFEPQVALVSAKDGMAALTEIIRDAPRYLAAGGRLLLEHGFEQGAAVREQLRRGGFVNIRTTRDLGGRERVSEGMAP